MRGVLAPDSRERATAQRLAGEIAAMPGAGEVVAQLEALAASAVRWTGYATSASTVWSSAARATSSVT